MGNLADQCLRMMQNHSKDSFVRRIFPQKDQSFAFVCCSNESIRRMVEHCCADESRIIGIDRTFNLSTFYVTVVVYQHQNMLVAGTNRHPTMVGALLIHCKGSTESYYDLFNTIKFEMSKITEEDPCFDLNWREPVFGSDDEKALRKAIRLTFPQSVVTRCSKHDKDTLRRYLKDKVGVEERKRESIVQAFYKESGILHSTNELDFEERVLNLCDEVQDMLGKRFDKFQSCFDRMTKALKKDVFLPAKKKGIPLDWTNNISESTNHRIRKFQNFEVVTLEELKSNLESLVMYQDVEIRRALYNCGTYRLTDKCIAKYGLRNEQKWKMVTEGAQKRRQKSINMYVEDANLELIKSLDKSLHIANQKTKKKPGKSSARSDRTVSQKKKSC